MRRVSVAALRELGYVVLEAAGGRAALDLVAETPQIDVLVTDVVMPEMTGPQLVAEARVIRPDLRVVFTTGYAPEGVLRGDDLDEGMAMLPKPFTFRQLDAKLREVLDRETMPV